VSRGIDEVDKVSIVGSLSINVVLVEEGDTSGLDGDTSFLFIFSGIGVTSITSSLSGDDTGLGDQGVSQSGLSVIDVSNDGHVSDVVRLVHDASNLFNAEVNHL